jgi:uncharacterized membrane protein
MGDGFEGEEVMEYLFAKWLHILSSTILFGAGVGSAFHFVLAVWGRDVRDIAATARHVVIQDWVFTATTAVFQPLSGFWLMHIAKLPASTPWIHKSLVLYGIAIACWIPVVWIQLRLRDMAEHAAATGVPLPRRWWHFFMAWVSLGVVAFAAFLAIFHFMVFKGA